MPATLPKLVPKSGHRLALIQQAQYFASKCDECAILGQALSWQNHGATASAERSKMSHWSKR